MLTQLFPPACPVCCQRRDKCICPPKPTTPIMPTQNQIASAICSALGMPSRFAAEKPPVSPTLRSSLAGYMRGLSDESLASIGQFAPKMSREAAQLEIARRAAINPETHCLLCGEVLSELGHCWQHPTQAAAPTQAAPYCEGQCGICSCIASPQPDKPALSSNALGSALTVLLVCLNLAAYLVTK